jgi:DNA mismatch repair protein MutS2
VTDGPLADAARELPDLAPWQRRVKKALDARGRVRDDASPELRKLRRRVQSLRQGLYGELRQTAAGSRELLSEETIPLHEGRLVLLLQAGARGRMPGLVHARSASGRSLYFEPLAAVEGNNRLQESVSEEAAERQRIINDLVAEARHQAGDFRRLFDFVGELDSLQAAWRYARAADGRLAEIGGDREMRMVAAHHPLLEPRLAALRLAALGEEGHTGRSVPVELELQPDQRLVVVTGPNAGGKTVTLKTVGLTVLAHQCGLPVLAAAGTRLPVLRRVTAAVGDEQDMLRDRSTFSGRLQRLAEVWEATGPGSLVLVDELGSGTDPEEGAALAIALLEALLEQGALALLTTHLTPLAAAALEHDGAWCAAMEFDPESGEPTFRLRPGAPGGSEALALARRLGLPGEWLDRAEELLGAEHRDLRRLLAEVESVRAELAGAASRTRREGERLSEESQRLEEERRKLADERKTIGRRLGEELEEFQRKVRALLRKELDAMREEVGSGRRKGLVTRSVERLFADPPMVEVPPGEPARPVAVGDLVLHRGLGWQGVLQKLSGDRAEVTVNGKRLRCPAIELSPVGDEEAEQRKSPGRVVATPDIAPPAAELKLIGLRVEPALDRLDAYLDQALLAALPRVRVIHGHGSGRLREAVREHLRGHPAVASHRSGHRDEGGNGATVVKIVE